MAGTRNTTQVGVARPRHAAQASAGRQHEKEISMFVRGAHVRVSDASPHGWTGMVVNVTGGYIVVKRDGSTARPETLDRSRRSVQVVA